MSARDIMDPNVQLLAGLSETVQADYEHQDAPDAWEGSPFEWIRNCGASARKGAIAKKLVSLWCIKNGFNVRRCPGSGADRIIGNLRAIIKFSTPWNDVTGSYTFQQFRDQDYEIAICLGVRPFDAHCWVITKELLLANVIDHTGQHGGGGSHDTAWFSVDPGNPPSWLHPHGGNHREAIEILKNPAHD